MKLTKRTFLTGLAALTIVPSATLASNDSILGEMNFRMAFTFNGPEGETATIPVAPEEVSKAVDMGPKTGLPYLAGIVSAEAKVQIASFPVEETEAMELIVREGLIGVAHGNVAIRDLPFDLNDAGWTGVLSVTRP